MVERTVGDIVTDKYAHYIDINALWAYSNNIFNEYILFMRFTRIYT